MPRPPGESLINELFLPSLTIIPPSFLRFGYFLYSSINFSPQLNTHSQNSSHPWSLFAASLHLAPSFILVLPRALSILFFFFLALSLPYPPFVPFASASCPSSVLVSLTVRSVSIHLPLFLTHLRRSSSLLSSFCCFPFFFIHY